MTQGVPRGMSTTDSAMGKCPSFDGTRVVFVMLSCEMMCFPMIIDGKKGGWLLQEAVDDLWEGGTMGGSPTQGVLSAIGKHASLTPQK